MPLLVTYRYDPAWYMRNGQFFRQRKPRSLRQLAGGAVPLPYRGLNNLCLPFCIKKILKKGLILIDKSAIMYVCMDK